MEKDNLVNENKTNNKRERQKKIALFVILISVVICAFIWMVNMFNHSRKEKIIENSAEWKQNAVTFPKKGSLQPAGYITINWNPADEMGEVKGYKVYVNDKLISETDEKTTTCEYYTTSVSAHKVYVEADLKHGSQIYSYISTFYVNKKGFCVNRDMAQNIEADEWGASWYYDWAMESLKYTSFQDLQFVPMMWSGSETDDKVISRFPKFGYKYVLAFNEPDRTDQANMEVDDAVLGMKPFMNKGLYVGSPATALCPPWSKEWFQPFMKKMQEQNMDVDFIPIHHYWNWYTEEGVQAFLELVDETWEMYHKPIWITEFAISGDPGKNKIQREAVEGYMKGVLPELDKREYVERYAWFSFSVSDFKNGGSALLQQYTGEIRKLGKIYKKMGMPEGYGDKNIKNIVENTKKDIIK